MVKNRDFPPLPWAEDHTGTRANAALVGIAIVEEDEYYAANPAE